MNILIVYSDPSCSCTRKNTFELGKALNNTCDDVKCDLVFFSQLKEEHFVKYDIIILQRLGGNGGIIRPSFIQALKNLTIKYPKTLTYYNIDDLLINNNIKHLSDIANYLLFPHDEYAKHFNNKDFRVTGPFIDKKTVEEIKPFNVKSDKIKILWASTALVGRGFMRSLTPLINKHIPEAELYVIGQEAYKFKECAESTFGNISFEDYISICKACDIHLNPISLDTPQFRNVALEDFLKCKCPVKYLNAAITKKYFISSDFPSYSKYVKQGETGYLLQNDPEIWIKTIKNIIDNPIKHNEMVEKAYKHVSENYTAKHAALRLIDQFKEDLSKKS